jgi:hypothetical protein
MMMSDNDKYDAKASDDESISQHLCIGEKGYITVNS